MTSNRIILFAFLLVLLSLYSCEGDTTGPEDDPTPGPLHSIDLMRISPLIEIDSTIQFTAVGLDADGLIVPEPTFEWVSTTDTVAVFAGSGLLTGLKRGVTEVYAEVDGLQSLPVTVRVIETIHSIIPEFNSMEVTVDSILQLTASVLDINGDTLTGIDLEWNSSKESVARVYNSGTLVADQIGVTEITARIRGTVSPPVEVLVKLGVYGTMTDIDGNVYETVQIGDQIWMSANLKVTRFNNGDTISNGFTDDEWITTDFAAYAKYNESDANVDTYGLLYNFHAVDDPRGLAPAGWHVPSYEEYQQLSDYLRDLRVYMPGSLKERGYDHWDYPNVAATNVSGFTALPGGWRRFDDGRFENLGEAAIFWTSIDTSLTSDMYRRISFSAHNDTWYTYASNNTALMQTGNAVRCVKD